MEKLGSRLVSFIESGEMTELFQEKLLSIEDVSDQLFFHVEIMSLRVWAVSHCTHVIIGNPRDYEALMEFVEDDFFSRVDPEILQFILNRNTLYGGLSKFPTPYEYVGSMFAENIKMTNEKEACVHLVKTLLKRVNEIVTGIKL